MGNGGKTNNTVTRALIGNTENFTLDHLGALPIKKSNIIIVAVVVSYEVYATEKLVGVQFLATETQEEAE